MFKDWSEVIAHLMAKRGSLGGGRTGKCKHSTSVNQHARLAAGRRQDWPRSQQRSEWFWLQEMIVNLWGSPLPLILWTTLPLDTEGWDSVSLDLQQLKVNQVALPFSPISKSRGKQAEWRRGWLGSALRKRSRGPNGHDIRYK